MSQPYVTTIWCDRCHLPLDCPNHPGGIPTSDGPDDVAYTACDCTGALCECPPDAML